MPPPHPHRFLKGVSPPSPSRVTDPVDADLPASVPWSLPDASSGLSWPAPKDSWIAGGLVVLAADMTVLSCDATACRSVTGCARISIVEGCPLTLRPAALDAKLRHLVKTLSQGVSVEPSGLVVTDPKGSPTHVLVLERLACASPDVLVVVRVVGFSSRDFLVPPVLFQAFGLSERECQFVHHFMGGDSMADIAVAMGISMNTGRVHLRHVLAKTGARNQTDLLRRLVKVSVALDR